MRGVGQVSRTGRVRVPPIAFWANQSLKRDPRTGGIYAIDPGFVDQITLSTSSPPRAGE